MPGTRQWLIDSAARIGARWPRLRRLGRYAVTSVVATAVSEATLLTVYGFGLLGAGSSAIVANLAGTFPSYVMSRYWIWGDAERRHAGRQAVAYWLISIASLVLSSVVTAVAAGHAPAGHGAHLAVVAVAYVGTYALLWFGKFALYQGVLFRIGPRAHGTRATWTAGPRLARQVDEVGR